MPNLPAPAPRHLAEIQSPARRWMNLVRGHEGHRRSFLKAVSWRAVGSLDTFTISFLISGKASLAGSIAAVEVVTKVVIYYLHERAWAVLPWDRR